MKLDPHDWEGRFVGYCSNSTSSRIYNPATKRVVETRNVILLEPPTAGPQQGLEGDIFREVSSTTATRTTFYGYSGVHFAYRPQHADRSCLGF